MSEKEKTQEELDWEYKQEYLRKQEEDMYFYAPDVILKLTVAIDFGKPREFKRLSVEKDDFKKRKKETYKKNNRFTNKFNV